MRLSKLFSLDIETTGLDPRKDKIICVGLWAPNESYFFTDLRLFREWLFDNHLVSFIGHNGGFDVNFLRNNAIDLRDYNWDDTCVLAGLLAPRPESLGLEALSKQFLNQESYKLDRKNLTDYPIEKIKEYCLKDCELTYKLFDKLKQTADMAFYENWAMPAYRFLTDMEHDGVYVDKKGLELYNNEMVAKRDQILVELDERAKQALGTYHENQVIEVRKHYKEMYEKAKEKAADKEKCLRRYALLESAAISRLEPFNWNSSEQLKWLLRDYLGLDIFNVREAKETTNEAMLASLKDQHEIPKILLTYRETEKLVNTCIPALLNNLDENSYVHTSYHLSVARTGRLSSSNPNLQQIPRGRLRSYIQAPAGKVLATADYAQIEVRIIAELAKETELINAFKEGIDPYSLIAQKLLKIDCPVKEIKERFKKERDVSKTAGLSILYGTGAGKLQEVLKKDLGRNHSLLETRKFIDDYRNSLPRVAAFKSALERSLANRKVYKNLLGRPFVIEDNEKLYMSALNTLVQGSASDLVVWSQTHLVIPELRKLGVDFKHRLIIHDEVVIELLEDEAELVVKEVIEPLMTIGVQDRLSMEVPLKIEYGISREWHKP